MHTVTFSHRFLLFGSKLEFPWDCGTIQSHAKTLPCARSLTPPEVENALNTIDPNKSPGPDKIPGRLLKELAPQIACSLCRLFNLSLSLAVFPDRWKLADLTPIFKKDDFTLVNNYRPISLLCTLSKVLERCVVDHCHGHIVPQLYHMQHGFLKGRSTITQLLAVYQEIVEALAKGKETDVIYLDFSKAFDKVSHHFLIGKLSRLGIAGNLLIWFKSYLSDRYQRVTLQGCYSDRLEVFSGVPQGSILGPLLFLVYINDIPGSIKHNSKIALFADDSKLYKTITKPYDQIALQEDLICLSEWCTEWDMNFNTSKCKTLNISQKKSPSARNYLLCNNSLETVSEIMDLGVLATDKLTWSPHIERISAKANRTLGLVKRICRDFSDVETRKLLYSSIVRPKLEYSSELWSPYTIKHQMILENVQRRATKFILNYPSDLNYKQRLLKLSILPLEYRRDLKDVILLFKSRLGLIDLQNNLLQQHSNVSNRVTTRNFSALNYRIPHARQNYLKYSYYYRAPIIKGSITSYYFRKLDNYSLPNKTLT